MKVYHVASTEADWMGIEAYLAEIDSRTWYTNACNGEALVEIAGRLCYKSFDVGLNPNVTRIRGGNKQYIGNLLSQHHGSVLEHVNDSFIITGVSRVLTHELVRHRHLSISQESLRYVRIEKLDIEAPPLSLIPSHLWQIAVFGIQKCYQTLHSMFQWDSFDFATKKKLTSAIRRLLPMGQRTSLMMTANARAWRWMIEARTALGAEEEIRRLFLEIYRQLSQSYPNIYQDAVETDNGVVRFQHSKV